MKHIRRIPTHLLSLAALALAFGTLPAARADTSRNRDANTGRASVEAPDEQRTIRHSGPHAKLRLAGEAPARGGMENLVGQAVRGTHGKEVGTLEDFMIHEKSGKIVFGVVSSGGFAGMGETLRLVPFQALTPAGNDAGFTTPVQQSEWDKLPAIKERDFRSGRINLNAEQSRQLGEAWFGHFAGVRRDGSAATGVEETGGDFGSRLVRATAIRGQDVRSGQQKVGEIEDVVVDWDRGTAVAVLDAEAEFTDSRRKFLVPLAELQIVTEQQERITTRLTRADFQRAQSASEDLAGSNEREVGRERYTQPARTQAATPTTTRERERLDPTGRADAASAADPVLASAARVVRQMWAAEPALAKLDLQVRTENGELVLRGTVPNVEVWQQAKEAAERGITRVAVRNEIRIDTN